MEASLANKESNGSKRLLALIIHGSARNLVVFGKAGSPQLDDFTAIHVSVGICGHISTIHPTEVDVNSIDIHWSATFESLSLTFTRNARCHRLHGTSRR